MSSIRVSPIVTSSPFFNRVRPLKGFRLRVTGLFVPSVSRNMSAPSAEKAICFREDCGSSIKMSQEGSRPTTVREFGSTKYFFRSFPTWCPVPSTTINAIANCFDKLSATAGFVPRASAYLFERSRYHLSRSSFTFSLEVKYAVMALVTTPTTPLIKIVSRSTGTDYPRSPCGAIAARVTRDGSLCWAPASGQSRTN